MTFIYHKRPYDTALVWAFFVWFSLSMITLKTQVLCVCMWGESNPGTVHMGTVPAKKTYSAYSVVSRYLMRGTKDAYVSG